MAPEKIQGQFFAARNVESSCIDTSVDAIYVYDTSK